jgi:hypothetical protein
MSAASRTNRSAKGGARASPHDGGEGVLTYRTKVFADGTVRRSGRNPRRTSNVFGWHRGKRINPTGARKVHPLIDKVYKRKNSEIARGASPILFFETCSVILSNRFY